MEYAETCELYKKINQLEKQLKEEREEHKEIYSKMRKNLMEIYNEKKGNNNDFYLFHLEQENTRLREENKMLFLQMNSHPI
jgi:aspartate ammonia-lyase